MHDDNIDIVMEVRVDLFGSYLVAMNFLGRYVCYTVDKAIFLVIPIRTAIILSFESFELLAIKKSQ
jgi:hypothetical protein